MGADDASRIRPQEANKLRKENEMKESEKKDIEAIIEQLEKFDGRNRKLVLDFCQHIILIDGLRNEAN